MTTASDTFVETSNTALTSHTPTGPNAGAGWAAGVGTGLYVNGANDRVQDDGTVVGNRYRMTTSLGSDLQDVQADVTTAGTGGEFRSPGVCGRMPSGGGAGVDFVFDHSISNGSWSLSDNVSVSTTTTEAWPGGTVKMRLYIPGNGNMYGYIDVGAGWVLKCTITSNAKSGNNYGGIALINFDGTPDTMSVDNYVSTDVVTAKAPPFSSPRPRRALFRSRK
jgi:hypothetical protein